MKFRQIFLLVAGLGLIPLALSYGAMPDWTLSKLFGISVESTNETHIFRGVMGLYLGFALFWILGAISDGLREAALWSLVVFMLGLAAGRVLSVVVDGMPHWLLFVYLLLELGIGGLGILLIRQREDRPV